MALLVARDVTAQQLADARAIASHLELIVRHDARGWLVQMVGEREALIHALVTLKLIGMMPELFPRER